MCIPKDHQGHNFSKFDSFVHELHEDYTKRSKNLEDLLKNLKEGNKKFTEVQNTVPTGFKWYKQLLLDPLEKCITKEGGKLNREMKETEGNITKILSSPISKPHIHLRKDLKKRLEKKIEDMRDFRIKAFRLTQQAHQHCEEHEFAEPLTHSYTFRRGEFGKIHSFTFPNSAVRVYVTFVDNTKAQLNLVGIAEYFGEGTGIIELDGKTEVFFKAKEGKQFIEHTIKGQPDKVEAKVTLLDKKLIQQMIRSHEDVLSRLTNMERQVEE